MRIIEETKLDYDDVLILPKRSTLVSRKEVRLERSLTFLYSKIVFNAIPIMAANMDAVSTLESAKVFENFNLFTCLPKFIPYNDIFKSTLKPTNFAISIGMDYPALEALEKSQAENPTKKLQYLCIDVANGYTENFSKFVGYAREKFPSCVIIAGNVATPEMTQQLILDGADVVKCGIGPGSHCLTREKTGVGYPQLSAVIESADAAHGLGGRIIADGGCKVPGDVAKAFGGGSDFVMIGSMFAAHDENSPKDKDQVQVYGMSSSVAMEKHYGQVASHRASEGRVTNIRKRGPLSTTILDLLGSLRSTCTYIGATEMRDFSKCTTFVKVNNQLSTLHVGDTIGD